MSTAFSETLCRIRKAEGFPTAYRFFHDNGGTKGMGFSYRQYLRMEQGKNLPGSEKLCKLVLALRLVPKSAPANALSIAWLQSLIGEAAYQCLFPFIAAAPSKNGLPPMHTAVKNALSGEKHFITPDQFRSILTDKDTYLCFLALSSDTGAWSASQIAAAMRLTPEAADKALKTLARTRLVKKIKGNTYKCPFAAKMLEYPQFDIIDQALRAKLAGYERELVESGLDKWCRSGIIRADASTFFSSYSPLMMLNLSAAQTYNLSEKTEHSALFYIEGRIIKLRDF